MIDILKAWWGPTTCPWCNNKLPGWFERLYVRLAYRHPLRTIAGRLDYYVGTVGLTIHYKHSKPQVKR